MALNVMSLKFPIGVETIYSPFLILSLLELKFITMLLNKRIYYH